MAYTIPRSPGIQPPYTTTPPPIRSTPITQTAAFRTMNGVPDPAGPAIKPTNPVPTGGGAIAQKPPTSTTQPQMPGGPTFNAAAQSGASPTAPGGMDVGGGSGAQSAFGRGILQQNLDEAWDNPEALLDRFFRHYGLGKGSGDYGVLLQQAPSLGILWMLMQQDEALKGHGNYVDWVDQYLQGQRTPGGGISPGEVMQGLLRPSSNPLNPIKDYLGNSSLTPADQVNNMLSASRYALDPSMPTPVLSALLSGMDQMGREFQSLRLGQTGNASFSDYLASRGVNPEMFGYAPGQ